MPDRLEEHAENLSPSSDRRKHARQRVRSITYVDLGQGNGGIILDASESGFSVQAVVGLMDDDLSKVRMKLPHSKEWLDIRVQIVWTRDSRKVVGLQFLDLSDEARNQIKEWLLRDASDAEPKAKRSAALSANAVKSDLAGNANSQKVGKKGIELVPALIDLTKKSAGEAPREGSRAASERPKSTARILSDPFSGKRSPFQAAGAREVPSATAPVQRSSARREAPPEQQSRSLARVYVLLGVLALLSMTAGWATRTGKFGSLVKELRKPVPKAQVEAQTLTNQIDQPAAPVQYIEIVEANHQHWTVPLQVVPHYRDAKGLAAQPKPVRSPAADSNPALDLPGLTLSAPERSESSSAADAIGNNAPPAVEEPTGTPEVAPPARLAVAATALTLPKPQAPQEELKRGKLIHRVEPKYPKAAKKAHVTGTVVLSATIGTDGAVRDVSVVRGPKMLTGAAINAVRQWRYSPTLRNGKPVQTKLEISLAFQLTGGK